VHLDIAAVKKNIDHVCYLGKGMSGDDHVIDFNNLTMLVRALPVIMDDTMMMMKMVMTAITIINTNIITTLMILTMAFDDYAIKN
jgi:hypothetical protein